MKKQSLDWVNLGLLIVAALGLLGGFAAWCDTRYQHADVASEEHEEIKELKAEVDALYLKQIPDQEKATLHHHEVLNQ